MKDVAARLEDTYLWEYREAIRKGEIFANFEMWTELNNLIDDYNDTQYRYDTTRAYIYIDFIENCVKHTKAPFYGVPFKLMLWQKALIEVTYSFKMISLDTKDWVRRFTEVLLWIARKNGKSTLIAALELTELFLSNPGSGIVCSGMNDGIADLCYTELNDMRLFIDPKQAMTWKNQKGIKNLLNNNFLRKLSDSTRGKEGRNLVVGGIDEIWELIDDGIYTPIRQSVSTQPEFLIYLFSSEGIVIDGFGDRILNAYLKIVKREDLSAAAKRKLPWIYRQDTEAEVWDTNEEGINPLWQKANPSIGAVKQWSYVRDLVDAARTNTSTRLTVLTKDFNIKQGATSQWLNPSIFNYESSFNLEDFKNSVCIGSVDLSETTDMTSAKIYFIKRDSKMKYVYSHYWIPQSKLELSDDKNAGAKYEEWARKGLITITDGNDIDLSVVADWFNDLLNKHKIHTLKIGYDQRYKQDFIKKCEFYGWMDKQELIMIKQSPDVLHTANCQVEADLKYQLICGLNEVDKWCLANAGLKINGQGNSLVVKTERTHRIDGTVTLIMCQEMLNRYKSELIERIPK